MSKADQYIELAKNNLLGFCHLINPDFKSPSHVKRIAHELMQVESGANKRLIISIPPRHGKSMLCSQLFPAWYLGRNPKKSIITSTYGQDLSNDFGRQIRDLVKQEMYQAIFPELELRKDTQSVNRMMTDKGGNFIGVGCGTATTGRGANLFLIDDPFKDMVQATSPTYRQRLKDWFKSVAYTRLQDGDGAMVIIMCMSGDTDVLMADGTCKKIRDIKLKDKILSYDKGKIVESKVLNWKNQGPDLVYEITTKSGIKVKANKRHPFLVKTDRGLEWIRLKNLKIGDQIMRTQSLKDIGKENPALQTSAINQQSVKASAIPITTNSNGLQDIDHLQQINDLADKLGLNIDTELQLSSMRKWLKSSKGSVPFAESCQQQMLEPIGVGSSALITATTQERLEDYSATIATLQLDTERQRKSCSKPLNTYEVAHDEIISIKEVGYEDVFDIQVEGTENFIANGLISHNTRWHEDDLVGWVLKEMKHENWRVINMPFVEGDQTLWPDKFSYQDAMRIKKTMLAEGNDYVWHSVYQQDPVPEEGILVKASWLQSGLDDFYPSKIIAVDPAISTKDHSDETAICVLGIRYGEQLLVDEIETIHGRWEFNDQMNMIEQVYYRHNRKDSPVAAIGVEKVAYQQALGQELARKNLPVWMLDADKDKIRRLMAVSYLMAQGRVRINSLDLRRQLLEFRGKSERNDLVDAFVYTLKMARDYSSEGIEQPKDKYEGMSEMQIHLQRYLESQRMEDEGVIEQFQETPFY